MLRVIKEAFIPSDLVPDNFPEIQWNHDNLEESVEKIFQYVVNEAKKSWEFYYCRRKKDRLLGFFCRLSARIAAAIAGIIPILGEIYKIKDVPMINPGYASIALAAAAFFLALDKLGGFTSGRVRFLIAGQSIFQKLELFRIEWEKGKLERGQDKIDKAQALILLDQCRDFHKAIRNTINEEIDQWSKQYQAALSEKAGLNKKSK